MKKIFLIIGILILIVIACNKTEKITEVSVSPVSQEYKFCNDANEQFVQCCLLNTTLDYPEGITNKCIINQK